MSRGRARPQLLRVEQARSELVFGIPDLWRMPPVHRADIEREQSGRGRSDAERPRVAGEPKVARGGALPRRPVPGPTMHPRQSVDWSATLSNGGFRMALPNQASALF
jgi:hypothetical protein